MQRRGTAQVAASGADEDDDDEDDGSDEDDEDEDDDEGGEKEAGCLRIAASWSASSLTGRKILHT